MKQWEDKAKEPGLDLKKIVPLTPNEITPLVVYRLDNSTPDPIKSDFALPADKPPYLVINLSVLDPKQWKFDQKHNVWRYQLDGGLQYICSGTTSAPDNAILADALDRTYVAVFWMENIIPDSVRDYWRVVRSINDLWEMMYSHRFDNVQQAAIMYGKVVPDGGKKKK